ncbi:MAG: HNH endonuclease, partial [Candidatus Eisenbacteria bacterium]|nr:HNH endonuclease [Candidatus Eisenbacteria bacterium]
TDRPQRRTRRTKPDRRHIPAEVKRAVWERDGGRCTFVSADGRRCASRARTEFDHIVPFARGGDATVSNLRLRCRTHNQWEAKQTFGAEFIRSKIEQRSAAAPAAAEDDPDRSVIPWLRSLGVRADQARRAAEFCATMPDQPIGDRVHAAIAFLGRARVRAPHIPVTA